MLVFYILFLLVIAYVFALKAASKIATWIPWLLFAVFMLSILGFIIDHWIISIIILFGAAAIFGMTIETEEDGKTIKPEPEGLKFYQRKVFKAWVGFIVFFSIMVGLANGPFAKHSDNQDDKKEKTSSSSSKSSQSESPSSTSANSSSSESSTVAENSSVSSSEVVTNNDENTTVYVANGGKSNVYWYGTDNMPKNTNKANVVTMTEAQAKQQGKRASNK